METGNLQSIIFVQDAEKTSHDPIWNIKESGKDEKVWYEVLLSSTYIM